MNRVAEMLTGWTQAEAVGRPLEDVFRIINEETRKTVDNPVTTVLREGGTVGLANHTVLIAKDGTEHAIDDTAAPIRETSESRVSCLASTTSATAGNSRRICAIPPMRLVEADHRKDEFLAMIAHELRNPSLPSATPSNCCGCPTPPPRSTMVEGRDQAAGQHLARLIDDLLDVSRITRGKIGLRKERIDASPVIKSAADAVRPLIDERKQDLTVGLSPARSGARSIPPGSNRHLSIFYHAAEYMGGGGHIR